MLCCGAVIFELVCCAIRLWEMLGRISYFTSDDYAMQLFETLCCAGVFYALWSRRRAVAAGGGGGGDQHRVLLLVYLIFNAIDIPLFVYAEMPAALATDNTVWVTRPRGTNVTVEMFNKDVSNCECD